MVEMDQMMVMTRDDRPTGHLDANLDLLLRTKAGREVAAEVAVTAMMTTMEDTGQTPRKEASDVSAGTANQTRLSLGRYPKQRVCENGSLRTD